MEGYNSNNSGSNSSEKPAWLERLMAEDSFFSGCRVHQQHRKNEKNIFCLLCCQCFCPHCLPQHHSHPLLQVRRYVYQDVVRLDDLEKLMDCSYIQPYTINSAKVIFLNQRAQSRGCKGTSGNPCFTCDRILQVPYTFCSLSCKIGFMEYHDQDLSNTIYKFDASQITTNSFIEDSYDDRNSTNCSNNDRGIFGISPGMNEQGSGFLMLSFTNRRKGAPSRSPLS